MSEYLGLDIGTSSIKAALWDSDTDQIATASSPKAGELAIIAPRSGWAEQDPESWWINLILAVQSLPKERVREVKAIGISYQMHGLVLVDKNLKPVRPSVIWCDSRAASLGQRAFENLGADYCFQNLLNSPGNFTAAKLAWVAENEPAVIGQARYAMLPGDFVALRLTDKPATTPSGLSEMILWDFTEEAAAQKVLESFGLSRDLLPPLVPTFGEQGRVSNEAAEALGIAPGTLVSYRAGDQPNNAFSLGCLEPGDVASTAGTSGVVYGISDKPVIDLQQRFNTFLHVNHEPGRPRYGQLLCINGCGSLYSWLRTRVFGERFTYPEMNALSAQSPAGSEGLLLFPFGNGAERILGNRSPGASLEKIDFLRHDGRHLCRAAQEGIVFALYYGMEAGISARTIRAGNANLFQSDVFAQTFASLTGAEVEIWDTDGAAGAARGAGVGFGAFREPIEAFSGAKVLRRFSAIEKEGEWLREVYRHWNDNLTAGGFCPPHSA